MVRAVSLAVILISSGCTASLTRQAEAPAVRVTTPSQEDSPPRLPPAPSVRRTPKRQPETFPCLPPAATVIFTAERTSIVLGLLLIPLGVLLALLRRGRRHRGAPRQTKSRIAGLNCGYCLAPLEGRVVSCGACATPYHGDCAYEMERCSVYACGGQNFQTGVRRTRTGSRLVIVSGGE